MATPLSPRSTRPTSPEPTKTIRPTWVPDQMVTACQQCNTTFGLLKRRVCTFIYVHYSLHYSSLKEVSLS